MPLNKPRPEHADAERLPKQLACGCCTWSGVRSTTVGFVAGVMWQPQASLVAAFLDAALGDELSGVFIHGSAALGGWTAASDLDILVTCTRADADWAAIGEQLLSALAPGPVVELSVVSTTAAEAPAAPWPFLLHVNQADDRVVVDGADGDPDLLMHYVVARSGGVTISGPPATAAFGAVPRGPVLQYLLEELAWGLEEADQRYVVLNACRALAYCETGSVLSKVDGGAWGLERGLGHALVTSALSAQASGRNLGPATPGARALVEQCRAALAEEIAAGSGRPPW